MTYLWLNNLQIRKKNESPDDDNRVSREGNCPLGHFPFLGRFFPFLDLRSEGLSNFASLSEPRFARSDNCSALLDIIPSSLRSRKVKISPAERKVRPHLHSFPGHTYVTMEELLFFLFQDCFRIHPKDLKRRLFLRYEK